MASPPHFYALTERLMPWLVIIFLLLTAAGFTAVVFGASRLSAG